MPIAAIPAELLLSAGSRWDGVRLLLGLAPAAGLVVGHALLLLPFQPS